MTIERLKRMFAEKYSTKDARTLQFVVKLRPYQSTLAAMCKEDQLRVRELGAKLAETGDFDYINEALKMVNAKATDYYTLANCWGVFNGGWIV